MSINVKILEGGEAVLTANGARFKVNSATVALVKSLQDGTSLIDAHSRYLSDSKVPRINVETYKELSERLVERLKAPPLQQTKLGFPWLWARFRLLPARTCNLLVSPFRWMFHPRYFMATLFLTVVVLSFFIFTQFNTYLGEFRSQPFSLTLSLGVLSLLAHELGHVGACAAFGVAHKGIQGGMMLFFPASFVELGDLWEAGTLERVIINFAGSFMQFLAAAIALVVNTIAPSGNIVAFAILSCFLGAIQLIPIKNSDGYWIIFDLFHKGSDQIFSFQKSLVLKKEMNGKERWLRHVLATAFLSILITLLWFGFDSARMAVEEILVWGSMVESSGWNPTDLSAINIRHLYRLIGFVVGTTIVAFLVCQYARGK